MEREYWYNVTRKDISASAALANVMYTHEIRIKNVDGVFSAWT